MSKIKQYTKDYVKERRVSVYPPKPIADKVKNLSEQTKMSISEIYTEGAKLYLQMNARR